MGATTRKKGENGEPEKRKDSERGNFSNPCEDEKS